MNKAKLFQYSRKIHKWAGLILGIQLLLWIAGGLVMSGIPRDLVLGEHLAKRGEVEQFSPSAYSYPLDSIVDNLTQAVKSIEFTSLLGQPAYKVTVSSGDIWYHAKTGEMFDGLTQAQIRALAESYYIADGNISAVNLLQQLPQEMGNRQTPMWQVQFDDWVDTTLYISPSNGQIVRVRSDIWRFYDFFWMLHIMDYDERSDSHNWLLISFSFFAFVFALTGVVLFFQVFKKRDFGWRKQRQVNPQKT